MEIGTLLKFSLASVKIGYVGILKAYWNWNKSEFQKMVKPEGMSSYLDDGILGLHFDASYPNQFKNTHQIIEPICTSFNIFYG